MEYSTVFHESLMTMYQDHIIDNRILFPGNAMVELGLAAGTRWMDDIPKASNGYVELNGMRFLRPFEISLESKMISEHTFGGGIVFREEVDDSVFATIDMINIISSRMSDDSVGSSCLKEWQGEHVREVLGITKRYDKLAEEGFHRGVFQSIQSAWLNEEQTSALARVCLPTSHRHKHDTFYLIHPALLDGVFQLSRLMINDDDGSMWVPSSIQRLIKHLPSSSFGKLQTWMKKCRRM